MEGIPMKSEAGNVLLTLNEEIYEKEAILAAAYRLTDSCIILVKPTKEKEITVFLEPKSGQSPSAVEELAKTFCNEVLDQQIRLDLERRFGKIREIIVRHAFSPIENLLDPTKDL